MKNRFNIGCIVKVLVIVGIIMALMLLVITCSGGSCIQKIDKSLPSLNDAPWIVTTPSHQYYSQNATLTSFLPVNQAKSTTDPSTSWPSMITTPPTQPATTYTENSTPGIFFAPIINAIWPITGLPTSFFWYGFAFVIIIAAGVLVFMFFAGKGQSALLIKIIVMLAFMIFFAIPGPNIYGMYVVIYFAMWCFGILVLSKSYGW